MLHLLKSATSRSITVGLIALLAAGLLIGAIRLALPFADLFRSELEGVLSERLGLQVRVGRLGLRLAGYVPQLRLQDAALIDPASGRSRLSLEQLRVDLNLAASLRTLAPKIEAIALVGARLVVKRLPDGTVVLSGLGEMEGGDGQAMTFFFGNARFRLVDSDLYWIDEQAGSPPLHLSDVRIDFENDGERHRFGILARLFDDRQSHLRLVGTMRGPPGRPGDWSGEVYLNLHSGGLDQVLTGYLPAGLQLTSGTTELESWNDLEGLAISRSLNRFTTKELRISGGTEDQGTQPLRLGEVGGLLRWQRIDSGWQLEIQDLALARDGTRRPVSDLAIRFVAAADGGWTLAGRNERLNLADAGELLARLPALPTESLVLLRGIRPEGALRDLRFRVAHRPGVPAHWAVSGRVEDLRLHAHAQLPGIAGLDAELAANERGGELVLQAGGLALDLPRLFPEPIGLDEVAGEIRWRRQAGGALQVGAREIVAANADIATRSGFSIYVPVGGSPFLDLHTDLRDGDLKSVRRYVPSKVLAKPLANWLDHAFVSGEIPSGALLFRGALADFPFAAQQGRFLAQLALRDAVLAFNPEWPHLEDLVGTVRFDGAVLDISMPEGRFLDSDLSDVSVRIPDLTRAVAVEVLGTAEGPFADDLRVLGETPLRNKLGAIAKAFAAEGHARLDLDLSIPLRHKGVKGPLRVSGELTWPDSAALTIADLDVALTDLGGKLRFTERVLAAEQIAAKLWGVPIRVRVDTQGPQGPQGGAGTSTRIQVAGRFPSTVLAPQFPTLPWDLMTGRSDLDLRLDIGRASMSASIPPIDFELTSGLVGLAVALPAPLGKPADGTRRLRLAGRLGTGEALHIQGAYGDLGMHLGLAKGGDRKLRLERGAFMLGGSADALPERKGLHLGGAVARLDLQDWLNWWAKREASSSADVSQGAGLVSADLRVDRLLLSDIALNDLRFDLDKQSDRWGAKLVANELAGEVTVPHRPRAEPIRVQLQRLDLRGVLGHAREEGQASADEQPFDPRQAHALDLRIEKLLWGEETLGDVVVRSQAVVDGLVFSDTVLTGPLMSIRGAGSWKQTVVGPRTDLALTATSRDLGEFLRRLDLRSQFFKAPAVVGLKLAWPGGPSQASAAKLDGEVEIDVKAGSLLEVEPGVGRMLGILNLEALQRRLALDFSDLFERGYGFEKIAGKLTIANGQASIEKLIIEGPSANVSIAGTADLVDKELSQIVTVTPRIGTGVAIASAVAGGPLVGAAVFIADQVSGGAVDKLGRHQYVLTGPWTEPKVRRGGQDKADDQATGQQYFLQTPGRAGASESQAPKTDRAGKATAAQSRDARTRQKPTAVQRDRDENLFLDGD